MSCEFTAWLITDDNDEAERFAEAVADFAMAWSSNVMCAATTNADLSTTSQPVGTKVKVRA